VGMNGTFRKRGFSVLRSDDGPGEDERGVLAKRRAADRALGYVQSGHKVGLGSGSTAKLVVELLGKAIKEGRLQDIVGVPTSEETEALATKAGIPLAPWQQHDEIDVALDGADEVSPRLDLVKGLGGALLREKTVAKRAKHFIVVVDEVKLVQRLCTRAPLPVEVHPSAWQVEAKFLQGFGAESSRRETDGRPFITDNGNYIIDARFADGLEDALGMARRLDLRPNVKAHGLFLGMAHTVVVATAGDVRIMKR
jgi:ribose 5-phosphate isomerase A